MPATPDDQTEAFRDDVLAGLAAPIPAIPARWLYDRRGSELFDEITRLPAYYPTRTETALLAVDHARDCGARSRQGAAVVEFGAGSATKTPILLEAISPAAYVPVDISGDYLAATARRPVDARLSRPAGLSRSRPISPARSTFPDAIADLPKLGFFPGSTIGNFVPRSATDLLRHFRDLLGTGAQLLIGMDRVKPVERLIAAYDDPEGVTARVQPQPARADQPRARRRLSRSTPSATRRAGTTSCRGSRCTWSRPATSSSRVAGQRVRLREGRIDPHREQPQI